MNRLKYSIALGTMLLSLSLSLGKPMPVHAEDISTDYNPLSITKAEDKISEIVKPLEINNLLVKTVEPSMEETTPSDYVIYTDDLEKAEDTETTENKEDIDDVENTEATEGIDTIGEEISGTEAEDAVLPEEEADIENESEEEETVILQQENNLKRWLGVCKSMGKRIDKNGFRYSNSGTKKSYAQALKKARKANCALYVSWCLQEYGILKSGQTFYTKGNGKIHKNFKSWGSKVQVIKVSKKCKSTNLKAGDIVCWKSLRHTNIYAGRNGSGQRIWYDAGKVSTKKRRSRSDFVSVGTAKSQKSLNGKKISYIIRIKGL